MGWGSADHQKDNTYFKIRSKKLVQLTIISQARTNQISIPILKKKNKFWGATQSTSYLISLLCATEVFKLNNIIFPNHLREYKAHCMGIFLIIWDVSKSSNGKDRIKYKNYAMMYGRTWNKIHFSSTIEKEK